MPASNPQPGERWCLIHNVRVLAPEHAPEVLFIDANNGRRVQAHTMRPDQSHWYRLDEFLMWYNCVPQLVGQRFSGLEQMGTVIADHGLDITVRLDNGHEHGLSITRFMRAYTPVVQATTIFGDMTLTATPEALERIRSGQYNAVSMGTRVATTHCLLCGENHPTEVHNHTRIDGYLNNPPPAPIAGDAYIVGPTPTGEWITHQDDIATWRGSQWVYTHPNIGLRAYESRGINWHYTAMGWAVSSEGRAELLANNTVEEGSPFTTRRPVGFERLFNTTEDYNQVVRNIATGLGLEVAPTPTKDVWDHLLDDDDDGV